MEETRHWRKHLNIANCFYQRKYLGIFIEHILTVRLWTYIKLIGSVIYCLFAVHFLRQPTDDEIITYVEMTAMGLLLTRRKSPNEEDVIELLVDNCKLHNYNSTSRIHSFRLVYTKRGSSQQINSFHLNGEEVVDRQLITSVLQGYHMYSLHPKCHLFSNYLVEYILDNKTDALKPSCKTSIPLHNGLVHGAVSPITPHRDTWYFKLILRFGVCNINYFSLLEETSNMESLRGHSVYEEAINSPSLFVRYAAEAHKIMENAITNNNLPSFLLEPLFNHIIVHSLDHAIGWLLTKHIRMGDFLFHRKCSLFEAFHSFMVRINIAKPTLPPFFTNKIRYLDHPFYRELYHRLKLLDMEFGVEFADNITASVMY